jgi:hypothetical protein
LKDFESQLHVSRIVGTKALPELDISGIMGVSLENALQRTNVQGGDQADADGLTEGIIA